MTFKQRLPYYLFGFVLGIIIVVFVFIKKNTTFDYGPNARVLKNIRTKNIIYSQEIIERMQSLKIDSSKINEILKDGNVDIWNKIKTDSCIEYKIELKEISLTINNCDSVAYINNLKVF